jgi:hypothetical protein
MDRLVCPISGQLAYDADGVRAHLAIVRKLTPGRPAPEVHRCSSAIMHSERPYHVGERRNIRRAA